MVVLCIFLGACATAGNDTGDEDGVRSPAAVTVTGKIATRNRPRFEPFRDAFFNFHSISFESSYEFSVAELEQLGMHEVTAEYPNWPHGMTARGPYLSEVLAHVGATGTKISVQALDGYTVEFDRAELVGAPAILAIEADGERLGIGGRGPAWLVFAPGAIADQVQKDDRALVWAVFHVKVE